MSITPEQKFLKEEAELQRQFEKEKVCFEENSEHLRSLNALMWQVPLIAMTLTGGLWYGIAQIGLNILAIKGLLFLAAFTDAGLIVVMLRMRFIFGRILLKTNEFYPQGIADTSHKYLRNWLVLGVFSALLALAATTSFIAAFSSISLLTDSKHEFKKCE